MVSWKPQVTAADNDLKNKSSWHQTQPQLGPGWSLTWGIPWIWSLWPGHASSCIITQTIFPLFLGWGVRFGQDQHKDRLSRVWGNSTNTTPNVIACAVSQMSEERPWGPLSKPKGEQICPSSAVFCPENIRGPVSAASRESGKVDLPDFLPQFEAFIW